MWSLNTSVKECAADLDFIFTADFFYNNSPLALDSRTQYSYSFPLNQHVYRCSCVFQSHSVVRSLIPRFLTAGEMVFESTTIHLTSVYSAGEGCECFVGGFVQADWWLCELLIWSPVSSSCEGCKRCGRQSGGQDTVIREKEPLPASLGFLRRAWLSATATPPPT